MDDDSDGSMSLPPRQDRDARRTCERQERQPRRLVLEAGDCPEMHPISSPEPHASKTEEPPSSTSSSSTCTVASVISPPATPVSHDETHKISTNESTQLVRPTSVRLSQKRLRCESADHGAEEVVEKKERVIHSRLWDYGRTLAVQLPQAMM